MCRKALGYILYLPIRIKVYALAGGRCWFGFKSPSGSARMCTACAGNALGDTYTTLHMFHEYKEYIISFEIRKSFFIFRKINLCRFCEKKISFTRFFDSLPSYPVPYIKATLCNHGDIVESHTRTPYQRRRMLLLLREQ